MRIASNVAGAPRHSGIVFSPTECERAASFAEALTGMWVDKTAQQAHDILTKPDVTVTNESDKVGQLPKIEKLDATVQGAFKVLARQQQQPRGGADRA